MSSFEFGTTAPVIEPVVDWDEVFAPPPVDEPDQEQACCGECCAGASQPEGGGLL